MRRFNSVLFLMFVTALSLLLSESNLLAQNLAKGKTVRQSSTAHGGAAQRAVDGNTDGNYRSNSVTHTNSKADRNPWWEVDLGKVYDIGSIKIFNRTDCCVDRLKDIYILVSETPIQSNNWQAYKLNQYYAYHEEYKKGQANPIVHNKKARGRYVRIFRQAGEALSLAEVEVYAAKATADVGGTDTGIDPNYWYRLTTSWQGDGKSLDVINDGKNNRVHLAKTGNYSGQFWKLTPLGKGFYRLTTNWQGDGKSLDVINDGKNNRVHLAKTGSYSGQFWKLTPLGKGFYRMTTSWQGDGKSLDVINDGKNNRVHLAKTGRYSGQFWKLTKVGPIKKGTVQPPKTTTPNQPAPKKVNGRDVKYLEFGQGGKKLGVYQQVGAKAWQEIGESTFHFEEKNRDDWSVYLYDKSRKMNIQLDLHTKKIYYSTPNMMRSVLYEIMTTSREMKEVPKSNTPTFATLNHKATYLIQPAYNDKVFDIPGGSQQNGAKLHQWAKHNGPNQQFRLEPTGGGYYMIVNVNSGKALDVPGSSMQDGTQIAQWSKHGGANQQFGFEKVGTDTYIIHNRHSKKVLDIYGGSRDNGGRVTQFPKHGRENQRFKLVITTTKSTPKKVNGRDVKYLEFGQKGKKLGAYQLINGKNWQEIGGRNPFNFVETHRDDWSVYLYDKSRNVRIQLDLHTKKVYYSAGKEKKRPIYEIMTTSREMKSAPNGGNSNSNTNNNGGTKPNNGNGTQTNNNGGTRPNNGNGTQTNNNGGGTTTVNNGNVPKTPRPTNAPKVVVKPKQKVTQPIPESQMVQMLNSVLGPLLGTFNVHSVSASVEDGQAIFKGTASIANVNTVEIEATLQKIGNSVGINTFVANLPNNAQMATQIIDRLIGTSLNSKVPKGFPLPTVRNFTIHFAEDGRKPEAVESVMGSSQPWNVLSSGAFAVEDIALSLGASGLNTGNKSIETALKGSSNLQGVTMAVEGNLTGNRADGADVVLTGSVGNISIGKLIKGVAGASPEIAQVIALVPDRFLNVSIQNLSAAISPTQKSFATNMKASFGDFEVAIQRNKAGKMAVTLGIQPPNVTKLIDLVGSPVLNGLKQLSDLDFALIVSSADGGVDSSLPSFKNSELKAVRGLNIITQYQMNEKFASLLGVQRLMVTGQIPKNPINVMLTANVESNAKIGNAFTFKGIKFELKPNPNDMFVGAGGDFVVHLKDTNLNFGGKLRMFPVEAKLQGELTLKAVGNNGTDVWQNPFGIPGVGIAELGIAPSITANFPWVGGAAKGEILLGTTNKKIRGGVTLAIDVANPHKSLLDAKINELSIAGFIDAFSSRGTPSSLRSALGSGLRDVQVYIAPSPMNLMGKNYTRGINIQGKTSLFGLQSSLKLKVDPESFVIDVHGEVDNIALRSGGFTFFELSGDNRPKALMKILASSTQYPEMEINAAVTVLEMRRSTLIKINKDLMKFKQTGSLFGGGFKAVVDVEARNFTNFNNANYYAKVKMTNEIQTKLSGAIVQFIKDSSKESRKALNDTKKYLHQAKTGNDFADWFLGAANTALDGVKHVERGMAVAGEYVTRGVLEETFNLKEIGFEAGLNAIRANVAANTKFTILGSNVNERTNIQLNVRNIDSQINKMAEQIGKKIIKELGSATTAIGNEVDGVVRDAGREFEKVGNWIANQAAIAAREAEKAAKAAGNGIKKGAETVGKGVVDAGKTIGGWFGF